MARYRIASPLLLFTVALTFFLICWGGIVKSTESSMGCPDWPLCHGQVIPKTSSLSPEDAQKIFWEQGHRLIATLLGICAIATVALLWKRGEDGSSLRGKALAFLGLVVFQGLLGAATVLLGISHTISWFHTAGSLMILMLVVVMARDAYVRGSRGVPTLPWPPDEAFAAKKLAHLTLIAIFFQIMLGAAVRHAGATWSAGFGPKSSVFATDSYTGKIILFGPDLFSNLNIAHRYIAFMVAALVVYASIRTWLRVGLKGNPAHQLLVWLPSLAVALQVLVGIGMVAMQFRLFMRTMHLGMAALLLVLQLLLTIELSRAARGRANPSPLR